VILVEQILVVRLRQQTGLGSSPTEVRSHGTRAKISKIMTPVKSDQNVWGNLVAIQKIYLAAVTKSRVKDTWVIQLRQVRLFRLNNVRLSCFHKTITAKRLMHLPIDRQA